MANILFLEKQTMVIHALAEGNSIRSIERMTGVNRNTKMSLGLRVGKACEKLLDEKMRGLDCKNVQVDEIWGFVGKKQKQVRRQDSRDGCEGHGSALGSLRLGEARMTPEDMAEMIGDKEKSECRFIEGVHVVERFKGQTVWDGIVLVFGLDRPPEEICYGWIDPDTESLVIVLNRPPVESPVTAVRAYIMSR